MKIGTKSLLYGYHCFLIHPWFVALGWWKLYGFPWDPRLWLAFIVHDWGYWGKPNMDGFEGELHPYLGARIVGLLFDWPRYTWVHRPRGHAPELDDRMSQQGWTLRYWDADRNEGQYQNRYWHFFTLCHSRYMAEIVGREPSDLCYADKLAIALYPPRLFLWLTRMTGEIAEYKRGKPGGMITITGSDREWVDKVQQWSKQWLEREMAKRNKVPR